MDIDTRSALKHFFPNATFVQVFFEAIANALDAQANQIEISIVQDPLEITIADNGVGLTEDRFARFCSLGLPSDDLHKGLGRLVYLAYFRTIHITSIFGQTKRVFDFSSNFMGASDTQQIETSSCTPTTTSDMQGAGALDTEQRDTCRSGTTLHFVGFTRKKGSHKSDAKPVGLKEHIKEHFLPLLHKRKRDGQSFKFAIQWRAKAADQQPTLFDENAIITEADIPDLSCETFKSKELDIFEEISMFYRIERDADRRSVQVAACVDGRAIPIKKVLNASAIPSNCKAIFLFESKLFGGSSDTARERLVLPEGITDDKLRSVIRPKIAAILNGKLPEIKRENARIKQTFEDTYPHLVGLFEDDVVGLIDAEEAIANAQKKFFNDQRKVLESDPLDDATYEKTLEISSRALTEYIFYREWTIKRMSAITGDDNEAMFHNLVAPRYNQFHGENLADDRYINNAWLLDDKFMTFRTLLSEATMQEVIAAIAPEENLRDEKRPDISMIFSDHPARAKGVDVVIVELKRRRPDPSENIFAGMQLVQRAIRLVNYYPTIQRIWYFGVVEIDEPLAELLKIDNYIPLFSRGEHVYYREFKVPSADGRVVPTPVCLLSFDAIIKDAIARNHAFLEILKDHFKKAAGKITASVDDHDDSNE